MICSINLRPANGPSHTCTSPLLPTPPNIWGSPHLVFSFITYHVIFFLPIINTWDISMCYSFSVNLDLSISQASTKNITSLKNSALPSFSIYCPLYFFPGAHQSLICIIILSFIFHFTVSICPKWPGTVLSYQCYIPRGWHTTDSKYFGK